MNALVSIIIPVYQREAVLEECVRSLFAQSYQNFEIILIDDGSTDGTPDLIRKLAAEHPQIRALTGAHEGISAARNKGLDVATGDLILFVDSDDVAHPLLIQTLAEAILGADAGIAASRYFPVHQFEWHKIYRQMEADAGPARTTYQDPHDTIKALFTPGTALRQIGGTMFRRDLIGDTRFRTDLYIGEDFYFIYDNALKGTSSVFLEQKWYYARLHGANTSNDHSFAGFMTRFRRRELVWKSELALGRTANADLQKKDAFTIFMKCLQMDKMSKAEKKKMCQLMKDHKKELWPALDLKHRIRFYLHVYFPSTIRLVPKKK